MWNDDLLPCPFCSRKSGTSPALFIDSDNGKRSCGCRACGASSGWYDSEQFAKEAWNTRHSKPVEADAELLRLLEVAGDKMRDVFVRPNYDPGHDEAAEAFNNLATALRSRLLQPERSEQVRAQLDTASGRIYPGVPPCLECGAMTPEEAESRCICSGDKDHCHGCDLWDSAQTTPPESRGVGVDEPPREVWVVSSQLGPDFVALHKMMAEDHAREAASIAPEEGPYRVCKYIAEPFAQPTQERAPSLPEGDRAWRIALIDALVVNHIYRAEHDSNPRSEVQIALDPSVSDRAPKEILLVFPGENERLTLLSPIVRSDGTLVCNVARQDCSCNGVCAAERPCQCPRVKSANGEE